MVAPTRHPGGMCAGAKTAKFFWRVCVCVERAGCDPTVLQTNVLCARPPIQRLAANMRPVLSPCLAVPLLCRSAKVRRPSPRSSRAVSVCPTSKSEYGAASDGDRHPWWGYISANRSS